MAGDGQRNDSGEKDEEVEQLTQRYACDRWKNIVPPICHLITGRRAHPCSVQHLYMHPIKQDRSGAGHTESVVQKKDTDEKESINNQLSTVQPHCVSPTQAMLLSVLSFFYFLFFSSSSFLASLILYELTELDFLHLGNIQQL